MDETGSPDLVGYCLWDIKEFSKIVKQLCELQQNLWTDTITVATARNRAVCSNRLSSTTAIVWLGEGASDSRAASYKCQAEILLICWV